MWRATPRPDIGCARFLICCCRKFCDRLCAGPCSIRIFIISTKSDRPIRQPWPPRRKALRRAVFFLPKSNSQGAAAEPTRGSPRGPEVAQRRSDRRQEGLRNSYRDERRGYPRPLHSGGGRHQCKSAKFSQGVASDLVAPRDWKRVVARRVGGRFAKITRPRVSAGVGGSRGAGVDSAAFRREFLVGE